MLVQSLVSQVFNKLHVFPNLVANISNSLMLRVCDYFWQNVNVNPQNTIPLGLKLPRLLMTHGRTCVSIYTQKESLLFSLVFLCLNPVSLYSQWSGETLNMSPKLQLY